MSIMTPLKELSSFITNNDPLSLSISENEGSQIIIINENTDFSNLKPRNATSSKNIVNYQNLKHKT